MFCRLHQEVRLQQNESKTSKEICVMLTKQKKCRSFVTRLLVETVVNHTCTTTVISLFQLNMPLKCRGTYILKNTQTSLPSGFTSCHQVKRKYYTLIRKLSLHCFLEHCNQALIQNETKWK